MSLLSRHTRRLWGALAALALFCSGGAAGAHPHVWIESRSDLVFNESGKVVGINVEWQFDEFYSVTAVEGLDKNKNGTYEPEELEPLAKENIISLWDYRYFTQVNADGKPIPYDKVSEFGSFVRDGYLSLYFSIPFKAPVDPKAAKIAYSIYDPTFYIAIELPPKDGVKLTGPVPENCKPSVLDSEAEISDANNSEEFYEKLAAGADIGHLYAKRITLDCLKKTAIR